MKMSDIVLPIDKKVDELLREMRAHRPLELPEDMDTLTEIYERLQFRKIYRINRMLFKEFSRERMMKCVIDQIAEEIEQMSSMT